MPAWVTPPTFTTGQVHTSEHHNDIATDLTYLYNVAHANSAQVVPANSWTTTSTTMVDWNDDTLVVPFTKRGGTETTLRCDIHTTGIFRVGAGRVYFGIYDGGTTYYTSIPHYFDTINTHRSMSETLFIVNKAAGAYSLKLRCNVDVNTFEVNQEDFAQVVVSEVIWPA